jgi:hypothetical protein
MILDSCVANGYAGASCQFITGFILLVFCAFLLLLVMLVHQFKIHNGERIQYIDISINREDIKLMFKTYRNPTVTCTTVQNASCHPQEHERAAFIYLQNRMNTYPINCHSNTQNKHCQANSTRKWVQQ